MKKVRKMKKLYAIILSVIIVVLVAGISIATLISKNRARETSGDEIQELENLVDDENIIDVNIVDENTIDENTVDENVVEENTTEGTTNTPSTTNVTSSSKYYIKINNEANVVTIYTKDGNGNYTVPVKAMICSIGVSTPKSGQYKIPAVKYRWGTLFGHTPGTYVYGQYTTQIVGNILFHSVPYTKYGDYSSLEYWEYDRLGTFASAGCIRLTVQDAKWIYDNISAGTIVEFYYSSNPGPLGKPTAKKLSSYPDGIKNWDPTDPVSNNPWKTYKEPAKTETTNKPDKTQDKVEDKKEETKNEIENEVKEENIVTSNNVIENNIILENELK